MPGGDKSGSSESEARDQKSEQNIDADIPLELRENSECISDSENSKSEPSLRPSEESSGLQTPDLYIDASSSLPSEFQERHVNGFASDDKETANAFSDFEISKFDLNPCAESDISSGQQSPDLLGEGRITLISEQNLAGSTKAAIPVDKSCRAPSPTVTPKYFFQQNEIENPEEIELPVLQQPQGQVVKADPDNLNAVAQDPPERDPENNGSSDNSIVKKSQEFLNRILCYIFLSFVFMILIRSLICDIISDDRPLNVRRRRNNSNKSEDSSDTDLPDDTR